MITDRKKIIVVDDNPENLTAIKNTLMYYYDIFPAPSASKLFELLEHFFPDLILLDVEMPVMNGYETVRRLKKDDKFKNVPIIFLTAMSDAKSEMEGLNLGAVDYIHKPFVAPLLIRRIKTHLASIEYYKLLEERNKSAEKQLELKTKEGRFGDAAEPEAQAALRAKDEFLSNMSHEIRTPLNAIIGMLDAAASTDDSNKIKYYLDRASSASKHLLGIINDLLDMSKIEENKGEK